MIRNDRSFKRSIQALVHHGLIFFEARPRFRGYVVMVADRLGLLGVLRAFHEKLAIVAFESLIRSGSAVISTDIEHLSIGARQIMANLKAAIDQHHKKIA